MFSSWRRSKRTEKKEATIRGTDRSAAVDSSASSPPVVGSSLSSWSNVTTDASSDGVFRGELTQEDMEREMEEIGRLVDPKKMSATEKKCLAQIVAFVLCNHVARYYYFDKAQNDSVLCDVCAAEVLTETKTQTDDFSDISTSVSITQSRAAPQSLRKRTMSAPTMSALCTDSDTVHHSSHGTHEPDSSHWQWHAKAHVTTSTSSRPPPPCSSPPRAPAHRPPPPPRSDAPHAPVSSTLKSAATILTEDSSTVAETCSIGTKKPSDIVSAKAKLPRCASSVLPLPKHLLSKHRQSVDGFDLSAEEIGGDSAKLREIDVQIDIEDMSPLYALETPRYGFDDLQTTEPSPMSRVSDVSGVSEIPDAPDTCRHRESGVQSTRQLPQPKWPMYPLPIDAEAFSKEVCIEMGLIEAETETNTTNRKDKRSVTEEVDAESDSAMHAAVLSTEETEQMTAAEMSKRHTAHSAATEWPSAGGSEVAATGSSDKRGTIVSSISEAITSMSSAVGLRRSCRCAQLKVVTLRSLHAYRTRLCPSDMQWARQLLHSFGEYLGVDESQLEGWSQLLECDASVEPLPLLAVLRWDTPSHRMALVLVQSSIGLLGFYSARVRTLAKELLRHSGARWKQWVATERIFGAVLKALLSDVKKKDAKSSRSKWKRWAKIGAAGVVGGAAIAFTGGLAAPAVAAGVATLGFTTAGAYLATSGGAATLTMVFGAAGAGYTGRKAHRRLGDITDFELTRVSSTSGLSVVIGICGWLQEPKKKRRIKKMWSEKDEDEFEEDGESGAVFDTHGAGALLVTESSRSSPRSSSTRGSSSRRRSSDGRVADDSWFEVEDSDVSTKVEDDECQRYWEAALDSTATDCLWRADCYALEWQRDELRHLGAGLRRFARDAVVSGSISGSARLGLGYTTAAVLVSALTWPLALLSAADVLDNPWGVLMSKAIDAGKMLADTLVSDEHGHRPVTVVGYSMGARVAFYACLEIAKRLRNAEAEMAALRRSAELQCEEVDSGELDKRKAEIWSLKDRIENVILLGAPCTAEAKKWRAIRGVVADRVLNCHSANDWMLKFVYRAERVVASSIAGLQPVKCPGVDNVDLSNVIKGHIDYFKKTPQILSVLVRRGFVLL